MNIADITNSTIANALTVLLTFVIGLIWKETLFPFISKQWYSGTNIAGDWMVTSKKIDNSTAEVNLIQRGHKITGDITWTQNGGVTKYKISGDFRQEILTATYDPIDNRIIDRGAVTLRALAINNKTILKGCFAWYDTKLNKISSGDYELHQKL